MLASNRIFSVLRLLLKTTLLFGILAFSYSGFIYANGRWIPKGPWGGEAVRTLAIDPPTPSTLYAGTGGGVFKYLPDVSITGVSPTSAPSGTGITMTGTGFSAGSVEVFFDGVPGLDVEVVDDTVTTAGGSATLPAGRGGFLVAETIPTLTKWGIILLVIALLGAGIYRLRR